MKLDQLINR